MEIEVKIELTGQAINDIAYALADIGHSLSTLATSKGKECTCHSKISTPTQEAKTPATPVTPVAPATPVQQTQIPVQQTPVTPVAQAVEQTAPAQTTVQTPVDVPKPIPTEAPTYTLNDLQVACAPIIDGGGREQILEGIKSFGVASLLDLPEAKYGEFAAFLRQLGGAI